MFWPVPESPIKPPRVGVVMPASVRSSVPAPDVSNGLDCSARLCSRISEPPVTFVVPVKVLALERIQVLELLLVSA